MRRLDERAYAADIAYTSEVSEHVLAWGAFKLNGKRVGAVWNAPWRVEITGALQTKDNRLEIEVTNLLPNRMIGDEQLQPETDYQRGANHVVTSLPSWLTGGAPRNSRRYTFSTFNPYTKDSPLLASGLLGPVVLRYEPPRN